MSANWVYDEFNLDSVVANKVSSNLENTEVSRPAAWAEVDQGPRIPFPWVRIRHGRSEVT